MENKKIALICDDERLLKIISLAFDREVFELIICNYPNRMFTKDVAFGDQLSLIIVALASPMSEPVVEISRAELGEFIGKLPILIISQHSFHPAKSQKIYQMDFPFDVNVLKKQVDLILQERYPFVLEQKQM